MSKRKVINPLTNRKIIVGGGTYNKLVDEGQYVLENDKLIKRKSHVEMLTTGKPIDKKYLSVKVLNDSIKFKKIIHISDIHIPTNLHGRRMTEYKLVFARLYKSLKKYAGQAIVLTGDLFHNKLSLDPDLVSISRIFLGKLSEIGCCVIIIPGNHDFLKSNVGRLDPIGSIVDGIGRSNIYYLKYSGMFKIGRDVIFCHSSFVDDVFIRGFERKSGMRYCALYHNFVGGCKNNFGKIFDAQIDVGDFVDYDMVLLGHVHRSQKLRGNIAYAGSLIQQNYGESIRGHGYLVWDVDSGIVKGLEEIKNDYGMINIPVFGGEYNLGVLEIPGWIKHLAVKCKYVGTAPYKFLEIESRIGEVLKPYRIDRVVVKPKRKKLVGVGELNIDKEILQMSGDLGKDVLKLHKRILGRVGSSIGNSMTLWTVDKIEYKNFGAFRGIGSVVLARGVNVICAPNAYGKTTVANMILYSLTGKLKSSSGIAKGILSRGMLNGYVKLYITVNNVEYIIERKFYKSRTGSTSLMRVDVDGEVVNACSGNKIKIKNEIKLLTNGIDELVLFNLINNISSKSMIYCRPSERISILTRICGSEIYEKCVIECKKLRKELGDSRKILDVGVMCGETSLSNLDMKNIGSLDDNIRRLSELKVIKSKLELELESIPSGVDPGNNFPGILVDRDRPRNGESLEFIKSEMVRLAKFKEFRSHSWKVDELDLRDCERNISEVNIDDVQDELDNLKDIEATVISSEYLEELKKRIDQDLEDYNEELVEVFDRGVRCGNIDNVIEDLAEFEGEELLSEFILGLYKEKIDDRFGDKLLKKLVGELKVSLDAIKDLDEITYSSRKIERISIPELIPSYSDIEGIDNMIGTEEVNDVEPLYDMSEYERLLKLIPAGFIPLKFVGNELEYKKVPEVAGTRMKVDGDELIDLIRHEKELDGLKFELRVDVPDLARRWKSGYNEGIWKDFGYLLNNLKEYGEKMRVESKLISIRSRISVIQKQIKINDLLDVRDRVVEYNDKVRMNLLTRTYLKVSHLKKRIQAGKWTILQKMLKDRRILWTLEAIKYEIRKCRESAENLRKYNRGIKHLELDRVVRNHEKYLKYIEFKGLKLRKDNTLLKIEYEEKSKSYRKAKLLRIADDWKRVGELRRKVRENNSFKLHRYIRMAVYIETRNGLNYIKRKSITKEIKELSDEIIELEVDVRRGVKEKAIYKEISRRMMRNSEEIKNSDISRDVYNKYIEIFSKKGIPSMVMKMSLDLLRKRVNEIFTDLTGHIFTYTYNKKGGVEFAMEGGVQMDQLSGFERLSLKISINQAIASISRCNRGSILIVDESFDCIDREKFVKYLPRVIGKIKKYYCTVLLISHRELPAEVIDNELKIRKKNGISVLTDH